MEAQLWKHQSTGNRLNCDQTASSGLVRRGPGTQLCSKACEGGDHLHIYCSLLRVGSQGFTDHSPTRHHQALAPQQRYPLVPSPNQSRSSRNGTHSSYRHVGSCAHEGVGHGVDELPADPKVTEFDLPTGVHQDVGRLDICREKKIEKWGTHSARIGKTKVSAPRTD